MAGILSQDDIEDLLRECGTEPTIWNAHGNMQVCCPVHGEVHPSCGVSSEKQVFNCFSCGASGNFIKMLHLSQPDQYRTYKEARNYIESTYDIHFDVSRSKNVRRYEELSSGKKREKFKSIPMYKIAPYKSGKETYEYFFNRGFNRSDMKRFMIGRDLVNKTVTIPAFNEDGTLAGVIGRYVSKNRGKNERYKIYDHFKRGSILYPVDKVYRDCSTVILVEGMLDAIWMFRHGCNNTLAKMGFELTDAQAEWIARNYEEVVYVGDNDERGLEAREKDREILSGRVSFLTVEYPSHGKDACDWNGLEIADMLDSATGSVGRVRRYED